MRRSTNFPYTPLAWDEVPGHAADTLSVACGAWRLDQLFIVPATPTAVLGIADRGIALWVDGDPEPHVDAVIALDDIGAIDQTQVLEQMRLTVHGRGGPLTFRYYGAARHVLDRALTGVRAAVAGYPLPLPEAGPTPTMPRAWTHISRSPSVRLRPEDPAVARFCSLADDRGALVALTPQELVVVRDPDPNLLEGAAPFAHDALAVPRARLDAAERSATSVRLRTCGTTIDLALAPRVADAVMEFAEHAIRQTSARP